MLKMTFDDLCNMAHVIDRYEDDDGVSYCNLFPIRAEILHDVAITYMPVGYSVVRQYGDRNNPRRVFVLTSNLYYQSAADFLRRCIVYSTASESWRQLSAHPPVVEHIDANGERSLFGIISVDASYEFAFN